MIQYMCIIKQIILKRSTKARVIHKQHVQQMLKFDFFPPVVNQWYDLHVLGQILTLSVLILFSVLWSFCSFFFSERETAPN